MTDSFWTKFWAGVLLTAGCALVTSQRVEAYIDPGTALSSISGIMASAGALLVLLGGVVLYPVRRAMQFLRERGK